MHIIPSGFLLLLLNCKYLCNLKVSDTNWIIEFFIGIKMPYNMKNENNNDQFSGGYPSS